MSWPTETVTDAVSQSGGTNSLPYTIKNPTTFITSSGGNQDWYSTGGSNDNLWNAENTNLKTIYDPCPAGWRVPNAESDGGVWKGWTASNFGWDGTKFGRTYDSPEAWYPAAGSLFFNSGDLDGVGHNGNYHTCSASGAVIYVLNFTSSYVATYQDFYCRTMGFSVRCCKE